MNTIQEVLASKRAQLRLASVRATEARRLLESEDWKSRCEVLNQLMRSHIKSFAPGDSSDKAIYLLGTLAQLVDELEYPQDAIDSEKKLRQQVALLDEQLRTNPNIGENQLNKLLD